MTGGLGHAVVRCAAGYDIVRIAMAVLLLIAGGLKAYQLSTSPVLGTGLLDSRWILVAAVEFELFFGLWLLANIWPKTTWAAAIACFGSFTSISLYKAVSGQASCGCFGSVQVNPWYTSALDLIVILSLLSWRPKRSRPLINDIYRPFLRAGGVFLIWLTVGLPVAWHIINSRTTLSQFGGPIDNEDFVVLEPAKWLGKRFPLLDYIDIADKLEKGDWLVVLFRHDCPKCREAIRACEDQARRSSDDPAVPRVAMVELPPFASGRPTSSLPRAPCVLGRLGEQTSWVVETPLLVSLRSALVIAISEDEQRPQLAEARSGQ